MEILNEGRLNPGISSKLSRDGILSTTDSINELNGKSAVVDLSKMLYKEDALYMQKLAATCEKVKGYTKKVIYIPVAKWFIKDPIKVDQSKTPLGSICRYIRQSPAEFKNKFSSFIFVFYSRLGSRPPNGGQNVRPYTHAIDQPTLFFEHDQGECFGKDTR